MIFHDAAQASQPTAATNREKKRRCAQDVLQLRADCEFAERGFARSLCIGLSPPLAYQR
jgi:hypothetical protein